MNKLEKLLNYLFYWQYKTYIAVSYFVLFVPIDYILKLFPISKKRRSEARKSYLHFNQDRERGSGVIFSFSFIFLAVMLIYFNLCLIVSFILGINFVQIVYFLFLLVVVSSYGTVYYALRYKEKYIFYFQEFDEKYTSRWHYLVVPFFLIGLVLFTILCIKLTWGFRYS